MATITDPKFKNMNEKFNNFGELPLRADETTAKKYVEDNGLGTYNSFKADGNVRFSNDYGKTYNYYVSGLTYETYWGNSGITYEWRTEFGYDPIISSIDYS